MGGWVKCPIENLKKLKHICVHYFIRFLGEHSNVNNVINALLCLCSCFYVPTGIRGKMGLIYVNHMKIKK